MSIATANMVRISEAAYLHGVCERTLRNRLKTLGIPIIKIWGRSYISADVMAKLS